MRTVENISVTERAAALLGARKAAGSRRKGSPFVLVYMSSHTNRDGATVEGFRPGYMAMFWEHEYVGPDWFLAQPPGGMDFYYLPRPGWDAGGHYVVDAIDGPLVLFSIEPIQRSA
ncbi:MAG TPA: hypothetical protein VHB74_16510 [Devosia sp.]|nr:hypothetical protein [Devosia sp.]